MSMCIIVHYYTMLALWMANVQYTTCIPQCCVLDLTVMYQ